jgi:RNA polymerase subunit RPABC4/transcription elongation factor Spt4
MNIDPQILNNIVLVSTSLGVAFIAALWLSIIFWVLRDIRSRSHDPLMGILSFLLVVILPLFGVVIYWIVRPNKTIEQRYQSALEEEALLQDMEKNLNCPGCGRSIEEDWILCPACHTRIKKVCISCGKPLELQWNLCPFCGNPQQKAYKSEKSQT